MKKRRSLIVSEPDEMFAKVKTELLQAIRDDAARQHNDINRTITELDEMSNEINATLAFLKARRGDKV